MVDCRSLIGCALPLFIKVETTRMHNALPRNQFLELLEGVARQQPNQAFRDDYENVLETVASDQEYHFQGLKLRAPSTVYAPSDGGSTSFVARSWASAQLERPEGRMLEIGCGTGALSLMAARAGWDVIGVDVNPIAVEAARANAAANGMTDCFQESDLFTNVTGQQFDVILFNLPFYHKASVTEREVALSDHNGGLAKRFLDEAGSYLVPGGRLVFTWSNCSNPALLNRNDWSFSIAAVDYQSFNQYWRVLLTAHRR